MTRVVPKLLLVAALAALALPASAGADRIQIQRDCDDGQLERDYPVNDLRDALRNLPADAREYGECRSTLSAAIAAAAGKGNKGGGGGGGGNEGGATGGGVTDSGAISPDEQAARQSDADALAAITSDPPEDPIEVGGREVQPGENGVFDLASAENGVPGPLVALLVALGVVALAGAVLLLRRHVPALARIPLPTKRISLPRVGLPRFLRR